MHSHSRCNGKYCFLTVNSEPEQFICQTLRGQLEVVIFSWKQSYLARLGPLTDVGFVHGGEGGGVVVDVQQADVNWDMAALTRIV